MSLNPFKAIEQLINEHGSAAILRERIELEAAKYEALQATSEKMEIENDLLRSRVDELERRLAGLDGDSEFVRKRGILWRLESDGGDWTPHCPKCEFVLHKFPPMGRAMYWTCSQCKGSFDFSFPPESRAGDQ